MKKWLSVLVATAGLACPALAQGTPAAAPTQAANWSDAEIQSLANLFVGSWRSAQPVKTGVGDTAAGVWFNVAPVAIADLPNALYIECAREDGLAQPYRQFIAAFSRKGGAIRMTTFEFRRSEGLLRSATGLWAAPAAFPKLTREKDLIATLAFDVTGSGESFTGATPHPYPTGSGGAIEMTAEFSISKGSLQTSDRGFGADGKVVWGTESGSPTTFTSVPAPVSAVELVPGLWKLTYPSEVTKREPAQGDTVTCHYTGYLEEGRVFDSSYERGAPFSYALGQPLIEGWNKAMGSPMGGEHVRLVIPAPMAYGERGRPGRIPPNSTLYYELKVLSVETPPPPPPAPEPVKAEPVKEVPAPAEKPKGQ